MNGVVNPVLVNQNKCFSFEGSYSSNIHEVSLPIFDFQSLPTDAQVMVVVVIPNPSSMLIRAQFVQFIPLNSTSGFSYRLYEYDGDNPTYVRYSSIDIENLNYDYSNNKITFHLNNQSGKIKNVHYYVFG